MTSWAVRQHDDPSIVYSGDWKVLSLPDPNDAFDRTSTRNLAGVNGSLSFAFNGTSAAVFGTFSSLNQTGAHATWKCFIDGAPVAQNTAYGIFPWESYCTAANLSVGMHVLTLNASTTLRSSQLPFVIDTIRYIPSDSTPDGSYKWMLIQANDPQLKTTRENGWTEMANGVRGVPLNSVTPGYLSGTSVSWYSLTAAAVSRSNPSFQLDPRDLTSPIQYSLYTSVGYGNSTWTSTVIDAASGKISYFTTEFYNEVFFNISSSVNDYLPLDFEIIRVASPYTFQVPNGSASNYPMLTLDYILLDLGNGPPSTPTSSIVLVRTSSRPSTLATVLLALGSLSAAAIFIYLLVLIFRHHHRLLRQQMENVLPMSYSTTVEPFTSESKDLVLISTIRQDIPAQVTTSPVPVDTVNIYNQRIGQFHVSPFRDAPDPVLQRSNIDLNSKTIEPLAPAIVEISAEEQTALGQVTTGKSQSAGASHIPPGIDSSSGPNQYQELDEVAKSGDIVLRYEGNEHQEPISGSHGPTTIHSDIQNTPCTHPNNTTEPAPLDRSNQTELTAGARDSHDMTERFGPAPEYHSPITRVTHPIHLEPNEEEVSTSNIVIQHEDSGYREPASIPEVAAVVELPPLYTVE